MLVYGVGGKEWTMYNNACVQLTKDEKTSYYSIPFEIDETELYYIGEVYGNKRFKIKTKNSHIESDKSN